MSEISAPRLVATEERRKILLFGHPLSHSLSPLLHNSIYQDLGLNDVRFSIFETQSLEDCVDQLRRPSMLGCAVTMPFKASILPYLDEQSPACRSIGACNTISIRHVAAGGRLVPGTIFTAHNTDCTGIKAAIENGITKSGVIIPTTGTIPALVIGGGATSRSAIYALSTWLRCSPIYVLNRFAHETRDVVAHFKKQKIDVREFPGRKLAVSEHPRIIVGCVPDVKPATKEERTVRDSTISVLQHSRERGIVLDMCYKPRQTALLQEANLRGWATVEGVEVLIHQGIEQDVIWLQRKRSEINEQTVAELIRGRTGSPRL